MQWWHPAGALALLLLGLATPGCEEGMDPPAGPQGEGLEVMLVRLEPGQRTQPELLGFASEGAVVLEEASKGNGDPIAATIDADLFWLSFMGPKPAEPQGGTP